MGSPANPISATTQKLEKGVSATADANGQATFVYPSPPAGVSWTGTLNCANAPLASVFNAVIGGPLGVLGVVTRYSVLSKYLVKVPNN